MLKIQLRPRWKCFTAAKSHALNFQPIQSDPERSRAFLSVEQLFPCAKLWNHQIGLERAMLLTHGQELFLLQTSAKAGLTQCRRVLVFRLEQAMLKSPRQVSYHKSVFSASGCRCCVVFPSKFTLPCGSRRMLTDCVKEHDAPLTPLAFALTWVQPSVAPRVCKMVLMVHLHPQNI